MDRHEKPTSHGKFRFITGRHAQFTQSGTSNNRALLDLIPENYVWINRRKAGEMGIKFGDTVEISSSVGKIKIKAYPTEKIGPDTIFFIHGFGVYSDELSLAYQNGGSDAVIIEDSIEPMHGASCLHETFVEVKKV